MEITEVKVTLREEERLKGYATITFDDCFVVRNIRLVRGERGLMVCMPSRKMADGKHKDVAHSINNEFRKKIEQKVLAEYEHELKQKQKQEISVR